MANIIELSTDRLLLRQWRAQDWPLFAEINADKDVMAYFPSTLSTAESNNLADKIAGLIQAHGWGFWAVELKARQQFIGFVGLNEPDYTLPVSPCTEIGWRLGKSYWGQGYATEAAKKALQFGFEQLELDIIYSFTSVANKRSENVMQRLGMKNTEKNFHHPMITDNHPLSEHVLYEISNPLKS